MELQELIIALVGLVAPMVLTFLLGLIIPSPIYQKGKKVLSTFVEAIEDDKITKQEALELLNAIKK